MIENKEVFSHATLTRTNKKHGSKYLQEYKYYIAKLIRASVKTTNQTLTDYKIYRELFPSIIKVANFNEKTRVLEIVGEKMGYRLHSFVKFYEHSHNWVEYQVINGHFKGLAGNIYFEALGDKGTLVYFDGKALGTRWPPKFIITEVAKIVFDWVASHLRSHVEKQKGQLLRLRVRQDGNGEIPRPKSRPGK